MYHHIKKLMYTVNVGTPNVRFGRLLLEQFGGANGELAAAMQYTVQGWNCIDDIGRRDLLLDIGTEELSHLEVVGALIRMHLAPLKSDREAAYADPLLTIAGGGGVSLVDSANNAWTANYLSVTGEIDVDLRSNIAAESRAKIVYERLLDHTDDPGSIDTLQFLMTREITHLKAFTASRGEGSEGDVDMHGPWQNSFGLHKVEPTGGTGDGLSVGEINGKIKGEERGKQDSAQKTTTAVPEGELVGASGD
jgi:Mn-containing catalase